MRLRLLRLFLLLGLTAGRASALNQVTLQPAAVGAQPGGSAVVELRIAFDQQALGGGIVVELNPAVAALGAFSFAPAFPDDPSLRLVCPNAADPLCDDFEDAGGARMLIAFGARLTPPACNPPLTGTLKVGDLTLDAVAPGQTTVTLRADDLVAGAFVGCLGTTFTAASYSGTTFSVSGGADGDGDGVGDPTDNCPALPNPTQANRDADGLGDACDLCPDFATANNADADGNGRGNACECGDQNADGRVDVSDIVSINLRIFTPLPPPLCGPGVQNPCSLCDADNNNLCNVSDIVAVNIEIFSPGRSSRCARSPQ